MENEPSSSHAAFAAAAIFPPEKHGEAHPMKPTSIALPDSSRPVSEQEARLLLAMCIFGEARGESDLARRAVAQVILNRAQHPRAVFGSRKDAAFEENLRSVILQPLQFSSLNPFDPNYAELLHPLDHEAPQVWERCLRCAEQALEERDRSDTLTMNSDHYFDDSILPPAWALPAKQTVKIGSLNFYRLYLARESGIGNRNSGNNSRRPNPETRIPNAAPAKPSADLSSGSRPPAKVCSQSADSLPPGPNPPRPHMSHPAPKSSRATNHGPGSYPRYGWSRGLSLLALLGLTLLAAACSDFERNAYRVLAVTQAEYEALQQRVAEAAVHGLITQEQWNRFQVEGHRFIAAHNAAVDAFALWSQTKSQADTARLQATLEILPRLVRDLNTLVASFQQVSGVRYRVSEFGIWNPQLGFA